MEKIVNDLLKEELYYEKLENGLDVYFMPKRGFTKKYAVLATNYGSNDLEFIPIGETEPIRVNEGIAHFLEHKMFEQPDESDAFEKFSKWGANANAFTNFTTTAYLFTTTENFYDCLAHLFDYVQTPHFTDENVEKEKGIIGQEIGMYDDDPGWQLYVNAMDCLYEKNPIKVDIAGTVESIAEITPDVLFKCYNNFYHPSNMVFVAVGDFEPEEMLEEIKKRLLPKEKIGEIKRIYPQDKKEINKKYAEKEMEVSMPIFMIGIKDNIKNYSEIVKRHIAIEILLNLLIGKSSKLYNQLYQEGVLFVRPDLDYEFSKQYAHILISGQSKKPQEILDRLVKEIEELKQNGINQQDFERIKKKLYGDYVVEYNDVANIGRMFAADYVKGINSFDYIDKFNEVDEKYAQEILNEVFKEENMALSVVKGKNK